MRNARDKLRLSNTVTQESLPKSEIFTSEYISNYNFYSQTGDAASDTLILAFLSTLGIVARQLRSTFHVTKHKETSRQ